MCQRRRKRADDLDQWNCSPNEALVLRPEAECRIRCCIYLFFLARCPSSSFAARFSGRADKDTKAIGPGVGVFLSASLTQHVKSKSPQFCSPPTDEKWKPLTFYLDVFWLSLFACHKNRNNNSLTSNMLRRYSDLCCCCCCCCCCYCCVTCPLPFSKVLVIRFLFLLLFILYSALGAKVVSFSPIVHQ